MASTTAPNGNPDDFPDDCLPPVGTYNSRDEMYTAIQAWAAPRGYAFTIGRSRKDHKGRVDLEFVCDRGPQNGRPRPADTPRQRNTSSRRIGCLFSVTAKQNLSQIWTLKHRQDPKYHKHNHGPSGSPVEHPNHRKLSAEDQDMMRKLARAGASDIVIRTFLRQNSTSLAKARDIDNALKALRRGEKEEQSLVEASS